MTSPRPISEHASDWREAVSAMLSAGNIYIYVFPIERSAAECMSRRDAIQSLEMFSFFRKPQDPSPAHDKEADGFVLLGQSPTERRDSAPLYPTSDLPYSLPYQNPPVMPPPSRGDSGTPKLTSQLSEGNPVMADLLNDIPFILAPHVLEVQSICQELPEPVPIYNLEQSFARFHYDFTLENSVLCGI
ncbi:UBAP1-MVB12-associated (UMA)-domain containing protein 1 [Hyperolius riggenbachi]|uniref:UBAP1-MVB12-associated (UMA)-domain containing protein 1 n=1 Tax=Hyperolius riggenbachi TaxID=752182 RepID=UPI0035A39D06